MRICSKCKTNFVHTSKYECTSCSTNRSREAAERHRKNSGTTLIRMTKCCHKCGKKKRINSFHAYGGSPDGKSHRCKECAKKQTMKHYRLNKMKQHDVVGIKRCQICKIDKNVKAFGRHSGSSDGLRGVCKNCRSNDEKEKLRTVISNSIRHYKGRKSKKLADYGIDVGFVSESIGARPGKNYELDHIIPLSKFDYSKTDEIAASWHPLNLQWITKKQNRKKSDSCVFGEYERYMESRRQNVINH